MGTLINRDVATAAAAPLVLQGVDGVHRVPKAPQKRLSGATVPALGIRWGGAVRRRVGRSVINRLLYRL